MQRLSNKQDRAVPSEQMRRDRGQIHRVETIFPVYNGPLQPQASKHFLPFQLHPLQLCYAASSGELPRVGVFCSWLGRHRSAQTTIKCNSAL